MDPASVIAGSSSTLSYHSNNDWEAPPVIQVYHGEGSRRSKLHEFASDIQHVAADDLKKLPSKAERTIGRLLLKDRQSGHVHLPQPSEGLATDRVTEHQRGMFFFGFSLFSSGSLIPFFDPSPLSTPEGHKVESVEQITPPDLTWAWTWKKWYVDMSGEVDDQGWAYSWAFRGSRWYSRHKLFRAFVRKRSWIRVREKISSLAYNGDQPGLYNGTKSPFDVRSADSESLSGLKRHFVGGASLGSSDASLDPPFMDPLLELHLGRDNLDSMKFTQERSRSNHRDRGPDNVGFGAGYNKDHRKPSGLGGLGAIDELFPCISESIKASEATKVTETLTLPSKRSTMSIRDELIQYVQGGRLDRERIGRITQVLQGDVNSLNLDLNMTQYLDNLEPDSAVSLINSLLSTLMFADSKKILLNNMRKMNEQSHGQANNFLHLFIEYLTFDSQDEKTRKEGITRGSSRGKGKVIP